MNRFMISATSLALMAAAPAAFAQRADQDPFLACFGIEDDAERLACFDRAAAEQAAREASLPEDGGDSADEASEEIEERTRLFGLPRPSFPDLTFGLFRDDDDETESEPVLATGMPDTEILERSEDGGIETVSMTIEHISTHGYDTKRFHMTNGQVWEVIDSLRVWVPRGDLPARAEIRRAAMTSYLLRVNGEGRAIRVRRVD